MVGRKGGLCYPLASVGLFVRKTVVIIFSFLRAVEVVFFFFLVSVPFGSFSDLCVDRYSSPDGFLLSFFGVESKEELRWRLGLRCWMSVQLPLRSC